MLNMQIQIKQGAALACALILWCLCCTAAAQAGVIFGDSLAQAFQLTKDEVSTGLGVTAIGDTVYELLSNGELYAWDPAQDSYSLYARVPAAPIINAEIPFSRQSAEVQRALTESVSQLIPAEDALYGFNDLTGRIGIIDPNGWHVNDVLLGTAALKSSDAAYPERLRNAFITEGKLYAFHDLAYSTSFKPRPALLVFDLLSGACTAVKMPDTITFCRYKPGTLLCLRDNGTETPALAVYALASGRTTPLAVTVPVSMERTYFEQAFYLHCRIGGLAYDAVHDAIYLADVRGLWRSASGAAFAPVVQNSWPVWDHAGKSMTTAETEAWVLSSGGYVFENGPLYIEP